MFFIFCILETLSISISQIISGVNIFHSLAFLILQHSDPYSSISMTVVSYMLIFKFIEIFLVFQLLQSFLNAVVGSPILFIYLHYSHSLILVLEGKHIFLCSGSLYIILIFTSSFCLQIAIIFAFSVMIVSLNFLLSQSTLSVIFCKSSLVSTMRSILSVNIMYSLSKSKS